MDAFESLTDLAVRSLSPARLAAWRARYHSFRKRLAPVMQLTYGTFDCDSLIAHLEHRIGGNFEVLMVHSSLNNMRPMFTDSPLQLVKALVDFCGPSRTLAMPAFNFGDAACGGVHGVFRANPRFDLRRAPSQMGMVSELFRRSRGVVQSKHPVYRVAALGPLANALVAGHERAATPSGLGTPFDFMANHDTAILGIGKDFEVLTQVHHIEDVMGDRFPVPRIVGRDLPITLVDGSEEIPFLLCDSKLTWIRDMSKLQTIMNPQQLSSWRFHHVPIFATRAKEVTAELRKAAERGITIYRKPVGSGSQDLNV